MIKTIDMDDRLIKLNQEYHFDQELHSSYFTASDISELDVPPLPKEKGKEEKKKLIN